MTGFDSFGFPCTVMPEDPAEMRLLGIYPQRTDGLYLQRVKTPYGRLTVQKWRGLADLVERFTPQVPLHLTTRQAIELHDLRSEVFPALHREIEKLGLQCVGAAGDTIRTITVSPLNGTVAGSWDVSLLAQAIAEHAESLPFIRNLPRKFKVSVSGAHEDSSRAWVNDLGLVANVDGSFRVVIAGSLGARPGAGVLLYDALPVVQVPSLVEAVLSFFNDEGDRQHRTKARLRHVRERLGDSLFCQSIESRFHEVRKRHELEGDSWDLEDLVTLVATNVPVQSHLQLPLGDIMPGDLRTLCNAVESADAFIQIGLEHDLYVLGPKSVDIPAGMTEISTGSSVVSCPGTTWCTRGIADSRDVARRILSNESMEMKGPLKIAISGCPNQCSHTAVADIGFVGRKKSIDGQKVDCFRLLVGGGQGDSSELAVELHDAIPSDMVVVVIEALLSEYEQQKGETLQGGQRVLFRRFVLSQLDHLRGMVSGLLSDVKP